MSNQNPTFERHPARVLESEILFLDPTSMYTPPREEPEGPYWMAGDIVEIGRIRIPADVSARLNTVEIDFRDISKGPEYVKRSLIGKIRQTDLTFHFVTAADPPPYPYRISTPNTKTIAGFPGVPLCQSQPFNVYTFSSGDTRSQPQPIPIEPNVTLILIARFWQNFIVDIAQPETARFLDYEKATLAGRFTVDTTRGDYDAGNLKHIGGL